ncbi:ATP-binding protein [Streptomyces sp. NBC_00568]|uniref:ATP-binding protein n=1 Tax=Streptomyces sp. NBC_00568 TaxID=2975779 RepID=UPI002251DCE0|nr:ATP-binding protein [Streptomyces sp. NBC_00568]MCX4993600.1 ATP-binding protein [Streptomyces sp. NBC_00568]
MAPSSRNGVIADTLAAGRDQAFVGRQAELSLFKAALAGDARAFPVHYLHGPGGIGKSTLLRRFVRESRQAGREVIEVDGRTVPPTPEGFLEAAGKAVSTPDVVLLVDTFERCQGLEGWLWERFLPRLPVGAIVVVAGRLAPDPRLISDPGWDGLLQVTSLRNLIPRDAAAFLATRGVPLHTHEQLLSFTGGNPLALTLAAALSMKDATTTTNWKPSQDAISTMLPQLIGDTPSLRHRKALEICAHAHVTSESLLRALMTDDAPELFAWLRAQPFVETTAAGVFPHDAVREALEADLRWRDPEGFAAMHEQMRHYFLAQLRAAPKTKMLRATGALIYLYRADRRMSEFNDWREVGQVEEQTYDPTMREKILELAVAAEGEQSASIAAYWLDRQPEAFHVYRSTRTAEVVAFFAWLRLEQPEGTDIDPIVSAAWRHARAAGPPRPGEHLGLARFSVYPEAYQLPSAPMTHMQWRATGEMIRADRLAWSHVVMRDNGNWNSHLGDINMVPVDETPEVAGHRYALFCHDWRAQPADPWLQEKTAAMLAGSSMEQAPVSGSGEVVVLSRPEFDVAVREALRTLRDTEALSNNPLTRSRIVLESDRDLSQILEQAAETLRNERGGEKRHRAVTVTHFRGSPTQEAAAERLGLPYSTYRRHLASAIERISDLLWHHELRGEALPSATT